MTAARQNSGKEHPHASTGMTVLAFSVAFLLLAICRLTHAGEDVPIIKAGQARVARGDKQMISGDEAELFNLAVDPFEKSNLASRNPERLRELRTSYESLAAQAVPPKADARPADFRVPRVWGQVR